MSQQADRAKLYFGFGSNLWRYQMSQRCPESTYLGVARLPKYRWIIYQRGYANVVRTQDDADEVYGLVYSLPPSDEAKLDRNEGVPWAYQKEMMSIEFWQADGESSRVHVGNRSKMEAVSMLVYIDHEGTTEAGPKEEYIYRMVCLFISLAQAFDFHLGRHRAADISLRIKASKMR